METSKYIEISKKHTFEDVKSFLTNILGYSFHLNKADDYYEHDYELYHYFKDQDYKFYSGVYAEIYDEEDFFIMRLWTDLVNHSYYDVDYQNYTIELFEKYFDAIVKESDPYYWCDPNFEYNGLKREKAESGCFLAYQRFKANMGKLNTYVYTKQFSKYPPTTDIRANLAHHPEIISNNLVVPYIISSLESYFRETFLALFKYSSNKKSFFKKYSNKYVDELELVSEGSVDIDRALVRYMTFQNISAIDDNFKILNKEIKFKNLLHSNKSNGITLISGLERLLNLRHEIIHRSNFFAKYDRKYLDGDIALITEIVDKFYNLLLELNGWAFDD